MKIGDVIPQTHFQTGFHFGVGVQNGSEFLKAMN